MTNITAFAGRPAATLFLAAVIGIAGAGCSSSGQLVLGIATDLPARDQLNHVTLEVRRSGESELLLPAYSWDLSGLPARDFRLPGSFNFFSKGDDQPNLDVVIRGLLDTNVVVERRAVLGIQPDRELFVRLALVARCEAIGCPSSLTCVEGLCLPKRIEPLLLPRYEPSLVEQITCNSGTNFIDTSTHLPLEMGNGCDPGQNCREGTCLFDPSTLPRVDSKPFLGGATELFSANTPPGSFFPVGALDAARFAATATLLKDGRVLVLGGFDTAGATLDDAGTAKPVPGAVAYEAERAEYRRLPDPPVALGGHTATLLGDGNVLVVGAGNGQPVAFLFDPTTDAFVSIAAPSAARVFHTATLLPDGRVLILGGATSSKAPYVPVATAELFEPKTRAFSATAGAPSVARVFHTATALSDGRVLVLGGFDATSAALASSELFRPATSDFVASTPMNGFRARHTATLLSDGRVIVIGGVAEAGQAALTSVERATIGASSVTWAAPNLPISGGIAGHLAIALSGDRVLVVDGAQVANTSQISGGGKAFIYDAPTQQVVALPNPTQKRYSGYAALLASGDVLFGGGVVQTAVPGDGGTSLDGGLQPDMSIAYCDPVGDATMGCSTEKPRCTVAGEAAYGPRLRSLVPPTCTSVGQLGEGDACTAGTQLDSFDDCGAGLVCARDYNHVTTCQKVCRTDGDCTGVHTRCALVMSGPGKAQALGICLLPCALETDVLDCADFSAVCRLQPNVAVPGGVVTAKGVCMEDGMQTVDKPCTEQDSASECSIQNLCVNGFCRLQCTPQFPNCGGQTCVKLVSTDPMVDGYCIDPGDMAAASASLDLL